MPTKEKMEFKTEVKQLLDLVIHSLYSNKEIFLRELISNASDACDKLRFLSLTDQALLEKDAEFKIKLSYDDKKKILSISDNGIGMTREEVVANIGTIAKSGTKEFLEMMKKQQKDNAAELIGQFGVGFYAAFMVADRVELKTRKAGTTQAVLWDSIGDGSYEIEDTQKDTHGTEITLHFKKDLADEFLSEWKIREVVRKYSDYIEYPIVMDVEKDIYPKDKDGKDDYSQKPEKKIEVETLNSRKAIWQKNKSEIKEEEYKEFYKHISHDFHDPLETIHLSAEGNVEFKALLYIPSKAPMDMFYPEAKRGLQLYVKRVQIMDHCEKLIPDYLRFMRGVVDCADLPLNVSREILQEDALILKIKKNIVNKVLDTLKTLKEKNNEKYQTFFKEFGKVLKEGLHSDFENKAALAELLIYESTFTEKGKFTNFKDYVERMPKEQKDIYVITGESRSVVENSPHLEAFKAKNYETLFLTDPIDEWVVESLHEYNGKKVKNIAKGEVQLDEKDQKQKEEEKKQQQEQFGTFLEAIKKNLDADVKEVRISDRLTDSPCVLVADENGMTAQMEQIFKAMNQPMPENKRILELNPKHAFVQNLEKLFKKDAAHAKLKEYSELLFNQALLAEGSKLKDPAGFAKQVSMLLSKEAEGL
jgi:molecular chaperone HtpG